MADGEGVARDDSRAVIYRNARPSGTGYSCPYKAWEEMEDIKLSRVTLQEVSVHSASAA